MQPAVHPAEAPADGSWRVSREGAPVAVINVRHERGNVVVKADVDGASAVKPYSFGSIEKANEFVHDLMTSFAYLGCDVAHD
jgi:hypothetical protein